MKDRIFRNKYNPRTQKFKQFNLEKMAEETSDFIRHLNFIFNDTPYKICEVREGRNKNNLKVYVTFFDGNEIGKEENRYGILLTNRGISVGDWSKSKYFSKQYKGKIKDYPSN